MAILIQLLSIYSWIVIISAISSWLPVPRDNPVIQLLNALTEPVYAPIRAVLNPSMTGGLDLSPIVVLFAIRLLQGMLARLAF